MCGTFFFLFIFTVTVLFYDLKYSNCSFKTTTTTFVLRSKRNVKLQIIFGDIVNLRNLTGPATLDWVLFKRDMNEVHI